MKKQKKEEKTNKTFYFFLLAYIIAIVTLVIIFEPFLYALILGAVLGVFFFPLNKLLIKKGLKPKNSALLLITIIFILIISSSYFFVNSVVKEATQTYGLVAQYNFTDADNLIETYIGLNISTQELTLPIFENINETLTKSIPSLLGSLAELFLGLFIMLFLLYYLFKDGNNIMENIMNILPVTEDHKEQIKTESKRVLYGVMYGQVLIAIIQGILGGLAFVIFGLKNPVFWGFIMGLLALIPILGTPVVWVPAGILQIIAGNIFSGIGVLLFGAIIMFSIENIIRPRYIGRKSGMHPILVILSIFGGIKLFGLIGLIIGPILVVLCVLIIKFFNQELIIKQDNTAEKNQEDNQEDN